MKFETQLRLLGLVTVLGIVWLTVLVILNPT